MALLPILNPQKQTVARVFIVLSAQVIQAFLTSVIKTNLVWLLSLLVIGCIFLIMAIVLITRPQPGRKTSQKIKIFLVVAIILGGIQLTFIGFNAKSYFTLIRNVTRTKIQAFVMLSKDKIEFFLAKA